MLSRRDYLKGSISSLFSLAFAQYAIGDTAAHRYAVIGSDDFDSKRGCGVVVLNLSTMQAKTFFVPIKNVHSVCQTSFRGARVLALEKNGPGACELDIVSGETKSLNSSSPARLFSGHACLSPSGDSLYVPEYEKSGSAQILVRDAKSFGVTSKFPYNGIRPHHIKVSASGGLLYISDLGNRVLANPRKLNSQIFILKIPGFSITERIAVTDANSFAMHLDVGGNQELISVLIHQNAPIVDSYGNNLGSAPIFLRSNDEKGAFIYGPEKIKARMSMMSDVSVHRTARLFGITHQNQEIVSFWSLHNGKFVSEIRFPGERPSGIQALTESTSFLVSTKNGSVYLVNPTTGGKKPLISINASSNSASSRSKATKLNHITVVSVGIS